MGKRAPYIRRAETFIEIGSGCWARVYQHPNDPAKVFKIGYLDDAWMIWAEFVLQSEPAPWLPRIYRLHTYPRQNLYIAVMEKLAMTVGECEFEEPLIYDAWTRAKYQDHSCEDLERIGWTPETMHLYEALHNIPGTSTDFHEGNFMLRDDNSVVITDPLCGGYNPRGSAILKEAV